MAIIRLHTLGDTWIEIGTSRLTPSASQLFSLLLFLSVERHRAVARSELCALLFSGLSHSDVTHNLRQLLYRLKRLGAPLTNTSSTVRLNADAVEDDVTTLLAQQRLPNIPSSTDCLHLLPHFSPPTAELSVWLEQYRDRIRPKLVRLVTSEIEVARASANWPAIEALAHVSLALDPYNETATLCLAEGLARMGSKKDALNMLREFEREVGKSSESLALPPRLLARRLTEPNNRDGGDPEIPLTGRHTEMGRLSALWLRAQKSHFLSLLVTGPESIGKTRLVSELVSLVRHDSTGAVLVSRRTPVDRNRPLSVFADMSKQLLSMRGAAGCSPLSLAFISRLTKLVNHSGSVSDDRHDSDYNHTGVQHALSDLFDSLLSERALLWIIDDAEYLDEASLTLLQAFQERFARQPCLLVLCSRQSDTASLLGPSRIRLRPLATDDRKALASAMNTAFCHGLDDDALDWSASLSAGNPGHMQLLLLHRAHAPTAAQLPLDLVAATDAGITSLSPEALHVLQACTVFGDHCTTDDIGALTGLSGYLLIQALQELEDNALITATPRGIHCSSGIVQERVLSLASPTVREILHRRSARRLEDASLYASSAAVAWRIAEHWTRVGASKDALRWKERCWQQSIAIGEPMAAVRGIRDSLGIAASLEERAALLTSLAVALRAGGESVSLRETLEERIRLSDHVGDDSMTRSALEFDLFESSKIYHPDLQPVVAELRRHVRNGNLDTLRRLRASRLLMIAADHAFDPIVAKDAFASHQTIRTTDDKSRLLHQHASLIFHTIFGDRNAALKCARELDVLADRAEFSWSRVASTVTSALAKRVVDAQPDSYDVLARSFEESRKYGMLRLALSVGALITASLFDDGRIEDARNWGQHSLDVAKDAHSDQLPTDYLASQIDLSLFSGDFDRAQLLLEGLEACAPSVPGPRMQRELLVYRARVYQFCGHAITDSDYELLLALHELGSTFGRHDDHAEVLWVALNQRGDGKQATRMLRKYLLSSRRELRPCNFFLRTRTADDPVWRELTMRRRRRR